jgi:hypothetical protein
MVRHDGQTDPMMKKKADVSQGWPTSALCQDKL